MSRPPDWEDVQKREQFASIGLTETLRVESTGRNTYVGDWLSIATFAHLHRNSYICTDDDVIPTNYTSRYRYADPLAAVEFDQMKQIRFKEKQSISATKKYDSLIDHARTLDTSQPTIVTYGTDESFWQALGAFEIADRDYIIFPEVLSRRWTVGIPDLTCFKLGDIQDVLADIGIIPGGAPLIEIELRAKYTKYTSTKACSNECIGVAEAKRDGSSRDGVRELVDRRNSNKPPYLSKGSIERGWIVSPNAGQLLRSNRDEIGGVTWDSEGSTYIEPPRKKGQTEDQEVMIRMAKRIVLERVLRYQQLSESLEQMIEKCIDDPEHLYTVFS
jgi:hypothetical protein